MSAASRTEPRPFNPCALVLGCGVNGPTEAMRLALDGFAPVAIGRDPPFEKRMQKFWFLSET